MTAQLFTRRDFSVRLISSLSLVGVAGNTLAGGTRRAPRFAERDGISHTAEAIHQEIIFKAIRKRVYEALTDTKQFDQVIQLGEARMSRGKKPTEISREAGGTFSLFGGYIVGRHIELAPNERLVQAWREISWKPGVYSIVKFEMIEQGAETKLVFDHTGFPQGAADHLAIGWYANYWEPLKKFLA